MEGTRTQAKHDSSKKLLTGCAPRSQRKFPRPALHPASRPSTPGPGAWSNSPSPAPSAWPRPAPASLWGGGRCTVAGGRVAGPRVRSPAPSCTCALAARSFPGEDGGGRAGCHHGRGVLRERGRAWRRGGRRPGEGAPGGPPPPRRPRGHLEVQAQRAVLPIALHPGRPGPPPTSGPPGSRTRRVSPAPALATSWVGARSGNSPDTR